MPLAEQSRRADDGRDGGSSASSPHPDRWPRLKALFLEALSYPASERAAFIERATSDRIERQELESLLASDEAALTFCETPAAHLLAELASTEQDSSRLPIGTQLGAYEITSFIAAGGMGAVYRARHRVLGRDVAIKTVARGRVDDDAKRRLIREARHASSLTHPNISAIYDVGATGDLPFIVMEYVDGMTLSEIVSGRLPPLRMALDYAVQIADALDHAHRHGIVHGDLKNSNVMVDRAGKAIVLDFGLARRLPGDRPVTMTASTATNRETFAGTLSHMAPELLRGGRPDGRSDTWAFGVLLYQLLSGELPFSGRTPFETSSAILTDPPRPMNARAPLALRLIIDRCLVKDPRRRYQSAHEVLTALEALRRQRTWPLIGRLLVSVRRRTLYAVAATFLVALGLVTQGSRLRAAFASMQSARATTLALLPLRNAADDSSAAYYADGVTDALIAQLGATSNVRVLSRVSTSRVAGSARSLTDLVRQLRADVIVQGTMRRSGDEVSLIVRLLRASDGGILWSDSLSRSPREILALEADVVRRLASAIQATLRPGATERLSTVRAVAPEVYESYLKGRYDWNQRTPSSLLRAVAHFTRAIQLDPTYAPAHAGLADCYNQMGTVMVGSGSPREYRPRAEAEAIRALQIDQSSAEAHAALGFVRHYQWRWAESEREFRQAIALNPSFPLARIWYANMLISRLRAREAIEQVDAARELDPFSLVVNTNNGWVLDEAGRHDDAIAQLTRTLSLDSTYAQARWRLASALASAGRLAEARSEASRLIALGDSAPSSLAFLAILDARAGLLDSARAILRRLQSAPRGRYVPPSSLAQVQASLGDMDAAMKSMDRAFAEGSNAIAYLAVALEYAPMRRDRRFDSLLVRAGLK